MSLTKNGKIAAAAAAVLLSAGLSGCGFDDVQFNGKIFDAVGMNTSSVKKEPVIAARQPLVVPPGLESLPPPGSGKEQQPNLADVKDYDAARTTSKEEVEKQQAEYCKKNYTDALARGDSTADLAEGPLGPCRASVLTAIQKWNKGDDGE